MTKSTSFFFLLAFPFLGIAETLAILTDGHDQVLSSLPSSLPPVQGILMVHYDATHSAGLPEVALDGG
jgi:hypothetical protein